MSGVSSDCSSSLYAIVTRLEASGPTAKASVQLHFTMNGSRMPYDDSAVV